MFFTIDGGTTYYGFKCRAGAGMSVGTKLIQAAAGNAGVDGFLRPVEAIDKSRVLDPTLIRNRSNRYMGCSRWS